MRGSLAVMPTTQFSVNELAASANSLRVTAGSVAWTQYCCCNQTVLSGMSHVYLLMLTRLHPPGGLQ